MGLDTFLLEGSGFVKEPDERSSPAVMSGCPVSEASMRSSIRQPSRITATRFDRPRSLRLLAFNRLTGDPEHEQPAAGSRRGNAKARILEPKAGIA